MKTNEIREKYLEFFEGKSHKVCPSDVLVPRWDKTVIFTPAGMNQFKDHFLGKVELEFTRAATCQKCLRTGDIENVGRTAYHHTFFEMLGNFSFGDYFKKEAIHWAWEFLTDKNWLGVDPNRLSVTVYKNDDEAAEIWANDIGIANRVTREDEDENFWPASAPSQGPDGVCGPCSEIYYTPDGGQPVEIWNLVFTQYNRVGDPPDNLEPLPSKNIDTGMGLERIAATMQGVSTNYHIDTLRPIVEAAGEICKTPYAPESDSGRRLRRITDHIRACTFCIHENVFPGAKKDEYVVKRLLRRAVLDGHQLGLRDPFLFELVPHVVEQMSHPYPELNQTADHVARVIRKEEENFFDSIEDGIERVEKMLTEFQSEGLESFDGRTAAQLYTSHGIPPELVETLGEKRSISIDWPGFDLAMEEHTRSSGKIADGVMAMGGPIDELKKTVKKTDFVGYETTTSRGESVLLLVDFLSGIRKQEPADKNHSGESTRLNALWESEIENRERQIRAHENVRSVHATHKDGVPVSCSMEVLRSDDRDRFDHQSGSFRQAIILTQSPFYGESGGQVGDIGIIEGPNGKFRVEDTQKNGDLIVHYGNVVEGQFGLNETLTATVNLDRRNAIRRAHSATHVLHFALQKNVGSHAQQRGSKVTDDWLRFDFANLDPVSSEVIEEIEAESNRRVRQAEPIDARILPLSDARQQGAMMLFGEKYPDPVRMVTMGEFSRELCGGTHLSNTAEIEAFEILGEEGVASGTRRITALTGQKAIQQQQQVFDCVQQVAARLSLKPGQIGEGVEQLGKQIRELKKLVSSGSRKELSDQDFALKGLHAPAGEMDYWQTRSLLREAAKKINSPPLELASRVDSMLDERKALRAQLEKIAAAESVDANSLIESARDSEGAKVIAAEIPGGNPNLMRSLIDQIRKKSSPVAVFLTAAPAPDKVILVAGLSKELVDRGLSAGEWVKQVAPLVGGGGGGRPDMAQAGGKQPENIDKAIDLAFESMCSMLAGP